MAKLFCAVDGCGEFGMKDGGKPRVALIIVAWNQAGVTADCLKSVGALDYPAVDAILVDNGSEPPLENVMATDVMAAVQVIRSEENVGFAAGYNIGLRYAIRQNCDFLFLLNNDTVLAHDSLSVLVDALQANDELGLVMPKIYYADEPDVVWSAGADYRPWLGEVTNDWRGVPDAPFSSVRDITFAPFCAALFRRDVFERVGLLDEGFFLYYEDLDYCWRMGQVGYRLRMIPDAHVWHRVSVSSGGWHSPLERFWIAQSSARYFKRYAQGGRALVVWPYRFGSAMKLTVLLLWRWQWRALGAYWSGLWHGIWGQDARRKPPKWVVGS